MFWVYKCNARKPPRWVRYGDWNDFFVDGIVREWGSTEWTPAIAKVKRGDTIIAYQTDRNELVGLAKVISLKPMGQHRELILKRLRPIGVKVRALKALDRRVAAIPAFQPGPIRTLY